MSCILLTAGEFAGGRGEAPLAKQLRCTVIALSRPFTRCKPCALSSLNALVARWLRAPHSSPPNLDPSTHFTHPQTTPSRSTVASLPTPSTFTRAHSAASGSTRHTEMGVVDLRRTSSSFSRTSFSGRRHSQEAATVWRKARLAIPTGSHLTRLEVTAGHRGTSLIRKRQPP